ncbi:uncharacterized protein [Macrobrachium rosenbergii]|uniref:uncharacterized protein n=1 Tax=Macrobrachium rosenbergii TaxID=79674 RepID=UPI0034D44C9B
MLAHQDPNAPPPAGDGCQQRRLWGILETGRRQSPQPIAFFSRKFSPAESRFSTFDRELCALYRAVHHFKFFLESTPFTIWTDHQLLVHAFTKQGDAWSSRQQWHLAAIAESTCTIKYLSGRKNPVARHPLEDRAQCGAAWDRLQGPCPGADHQPRDSSLLHRHHVAQVEGRAPRPWGANTAVRRKHCPTEPTGTRLLLPSGVRCYPQAVPPLRHDDGQAVGREVRLAQYTEGRDGLGETVHPVPDQHARYLLTIIDRSTRWPEATPMQEDTASACTKALFSSWISRFSVLDHRTTDRGPAFLSKLWLRAMPRANGDLSAAEKVYREPLIVPGELITGDRHNLTVQRLHDTVGKFAPCQQTYTNGTSPFTPPSLSSTTHVFVRNDAVRPPLTRLYRGPFRVLERNAKAFQLAIHRKDNWVPVDRLKPTLLEEDIDSTLSRHRCPLSQPNPKGNVLRDDVQFVWGDGQQLAFQNIKDALVTLPVLKFPELEHPFTWVTDASHIGIEPVGGALAEGCKVLLQADESLGKVRAVPRLHGGR